MATLERETPPETAVMTELAAPPGTVIITKPEGAMETVTIPMQVTMLS